MKKISHKENDDNCIKYRNFAKNATISLKMKKCHGNMYFKIYFQCNAKYSEIIPDKNMTFGLGQRNSANNEISREKMNKFLPKITKFHFKKFH
jgi:hypothetical protein